jgi:FG-GAP-like repeat/FG-GAP repeat
MRKLLVLLALTGFLAVADSRPPDIPFQIEMIDPGQSEPAAAADLNHDGKPDIISGEYWYEAPTWKKHQFRQINYVGNYIDDFVDIPIDVNRDGYPDVVSVTYFSHKMSWFQNPGANTAKSDAPWAEHIIDDSGPIEFAFLVDIGNTGKKRDLLPQFVSQRLPLAWYELKDGNWLKHTVSDRSYGHGIGAGDVNGDGRTDILTSKGWFEAPPDPRSPNWKFHPDWDSNSGASYCGLNSTSITGQGTPPPLVPGSQPGELGFMHVIDVNGDGLPDVLTTCAHDYGVFWLEQRPDHQWAKHNIDYTWSQAHYSVLADMRGDGHLELVTGKRYFAHNGNDPGAREPLGVYWYEFRSNPQHAVEWIRHVISYGGRMGGGTELQVVDIDGDGDMDVVAGGKSGLFLARNMTNENAKIAAAKGSPAH